VILIAGGTAEAAPLDIIANATIVISTRFGWVMIRMPP
jgi:hypothetical protein